MLSIERHESDSTLAVTCEAEVQSPLRFSASDIIRRRPERAQIEELVYDRSRDGLSARADHSCSERRSILKDDGLRQCRRSGILRRRRKFE
jgi:hypothetical protein